jgi:hypothetical protein
VKLVGKSKSDAGTLQTFLQFLRELSSCSTSGRVIISSHGASSQARYVLLDARGKFEFFFKFGGLLAAASSVVLTSGTLVPLELLTAISSFASFSNPLWPCPLTNACCTFPHLPHNAASSTENPAGKTKSREHRRSLWPCCRRSRPADVPAVPARAFKLQRLRLRHRKWPRRLREGQVRPPRREQQIRGPACRGTLRCAHQRHPHTA